MKFRCPRCLKESVGREYHPVCFDELYREQQIIAKYVKKQKEERMKKEVSLIALAVVAPDARAAAKRRGIKPENGNELEEAEVLWSSVLDGRVFNQKHRKEHN
jgi:hypothetical protein